MAISLPVAAFVALTRLPRFARNDNTGKTGYAGAVTRCLRRRNFTVIKLQFAGNTVGLAYLETKPASGKFAVPQMAAT